MKKKNDCVKNGLMCASNGFVNPKSLPKKRGPLTRDQAEKAIVKCHTTECKLTERDHQLFYDGEIQTLMGKDGLSTSMDTDDLLDYFNDPKLFKVAKVTTDRYGNKTQHMVRKEQDCLSCDLRKGKVNTFEYTKGKKKDMKKAFICKGCQNEIRKEHDYEIINGEKH